MSSYYEKFLATGEVKCIDEEIPFGIPDGWEWCRLRDIILGTNAGKSPNCEKRPKKSEEWGVLTTTSIQENAFLSNENKVLPKHYVIIPEHCVRYGDILITRAGPVNRTGIVCMVENNCDKLILSDKTVRIDYMHDYCNPKFLVFVLNSSAIHELVMSATVGMAASQVNVSQGSIQNTLIPFPPSKEQQRIINKLEALLPQIEKYNNAQNKLDELNKTVKDIIKKSVLQEAIQGKLVSQLEEEGTAKELLGQIKAEKQRLVKDGKLKKSALNDSVIFKGDDNKYYEQVGKEVKEVSEEIRFDLPNKWQWCRLGTIFMHNNGKQLNKGNTQGKLMKYITTSNLYWDGFVLDSLKTMPFEINEIERCMAVKGDLLVCEGGDIGRSCIWNYDFPIMLQNHIHKLRPYIQVWTKYFYYVLYLYNLTGLIGGKGIGIQGFSSKALHNTLVPLPPLQEQQRIVAQIEKLFEQLK